jgi:hypothetical protein
MDKAAELIMLAVDRQEWPLEEATQHLNLALTAVVVRAFGDDKGSELLAKFSPVLREIAAERQRQIGKGYDATHDDDEHGDEQLATAAADLLTPDSLSFTPLIPWVLPIMGKHLDRRERLIIALALGLAEIERLDRAKAAT